MLASARLRQWKGSANRVLLTRVLFPALRRCPPRVAFGALEVLGDLRRRLSWRSRAALRQRVTSIFGPLPDARLDEIVRGLFVNRVAARLPELSLANCSEAELAELVTIEGREHLDRALQQGRGVILLGAHLGSSRVTCYVLRRLGYPVVRASVHPGRGPLRDMEEEIYASLGRATGVVFEDIFFQSLSDGVLLAVDLWRMRTALGSNKLLYVMGDGRVGQRVVSTPFLGRPTRFPAGWVSLARVTRAPVIPAFSTRRCRTASFRIRLGASLPRELFEANDPVPAVADYAGRLEEHVRRYPCEALRLVFGVFEDERAPTAGESPVPS